MSATGYNRHRDHRGRHLQRVQACRYCKRPMFWVTMNTGKRNPLNLEQLEGDVPADVLVIQHQRGGPQGEKWILGVVVHPDLAEEAEHLAQELHSSHFTDEACPGNAGRIAADARRRGEDS